MIKIELPKPLILLTAILLISVIVSIVLLLYDINILWAVADIALVITLVAVVFYVYYTYLLAKETWTPSASFQVKTTSDAFHFKFFIKSYSKSLLECWCNLNATVNGKPVSSTGFYANQSPVLLQPFGEFDGHFDIRPLLAQVNYTINQMKKEYEENNKKGQLYFDIEFCYSPIGQKKKVHNPTQPYFFDFNRLMLIKDF